MARRVRIAACQGVWTNDTKTNLKRMEDFIIGISKDWRDTVKLISFTEYAVQGFDPTQLAETAEPIPGPASDKICEMAVKYKYWICNGSMTEKRKGELYNTSLIISPKGKIVGRYSKTHPWCEPYATETVMWGKEFPVFDIPGIGKVGIMICYDGFFPEVARTLAWNGAELILWPTQAFHPLAVHCAVLSVARAIENSCYVMTINGTGQHVGIGPCGHSSIVDPDGLTICEAGDGETILIDTIDLDNVTLARKEGGKGMLPIFRHMKLFEHKYVHYGRDFGKGPIFKQIE